MTETSAGKRAYREFSELQIARGFVTAELWRVSRHPAFFLELWFWGTIYLWGAVTTGTGLNYSVVGVLAYIVLFQCSTRLTEWITARKYPDYAAYQRRVGMLCPLPFMMWHEPGGETSGRQVTGNDAPRNEGLTLDSVLRQGFGT